MSAGPNPYVGSSFDHSLVEQRVDEEVVEVTSKRVQAFQLAQTIATEHLGPDEMAAALARGIGKLKSCSTPPTMPSN